MSDAIGKVRVPAKSYGKCQCCGEKWHRDERMFVLKFEDKKDEKVCRFCAEDMHGDVETFTQTEWEGILSGESENRAEREREAYGAYLAAGATEEYFDDLNNGFV